MKSKILKRVLIGIAIFLGIVIVAVGIFAALQWRNIKALYISMTTDSEVISEMMAENDEKYTSEIQNFLSGSIRDFTDEELAQIESGERSKLDVLASIIAETYDESSAVNSNSNSQDSSAASNTDSDAASDAASNENAAAGTGSGQNSTVNSGTSTAANSDKNSGTNSSSSSSSSSGSGTSSNSSSSSGSSSATSSSSNSSSSSNKTSGTNAGTTSASSSSGQTTAEAIVAKHVANLYAYQSEFESRVSALASSVTAYTHSYKATHSDATWREAKTAAVTKYLSQASSIESECYSKVDSEIAALKSELKAIGADTAIADQVASAAETQMQLKKSSIMSQYTSKINNPG